MNGNQPKQNRYASSNDECGEREDEIALMHVDANMKTTLVICLLKSFYDLLNLLRFLLKKPSKASHLPNLSKLKQMHQDYWQNKQSLDYLVQVYTFLTLQKLGEFFSAQRKVSRVVTVMTNTSNHGEMGKTCFVSIL